MRQAIVEFPSDTSYSENKIIGYILFKQNNKNSPVIVEVNIEGLPEGSHGFHIHEYPIKLQYLNQLKVGIAPKDLCKTLGGHFNPTNSIHGSYKYNTERHVGDLINNLNVDRNNNVKIEFMDPLISLYDGYNCIINRSIVIHKDTDDEGILGLNAMLQNKKLNKKEEESLKTGNAGNRIACGNINLVKF